MLSGYSIVKGKKMRQGYTTGTCATAAAVAGATMLLTGREVEQVKVILPQGDEAVLSIEDIELTKEFSRCCVTKDGGDDPDATHGAQIYAKVTLTNEKASVAIAGGVGVGVVTTEGMRCAKGEAAINPVPRKMLRDNLKRLGENLDYDGGFYVEISVPKGEEIADHTYNSRLGIIGGISILGTTGIVEPMSEKALVDTIRVDMDRRYAQDEEKIIIAPGNYGQDYCTNELGIDIDEAVKISNFVGEALDYIRYKGFKKVLLVGHTGKLIKLAGGIMNTHSSYADCRMEIISAYVGLLGGDKEKIKEILGCVTTDEAFNLVRDEDFYQELKAKIIERVKYHLDFRLRDQLDIEFIMFTTDKTHVMKSSGADEMLKCFITK